MIILQEYLQLFPDFKAKITHIGILNIFMFFFILGRSQSAIDKRTIHLVDTATLENRYITVRQLTKAVKISVGSLDKIILDHLHLQKLFAR